MKSHATQLGNNTSPFLYKSRFGSQEFISIFKKYNWPLENAKVRGTNPPCSQKSVYNLELALHVSGP